MHPNQLSHHLAPTPRPYQREAIRAVTDTTKEAIRSAITGDGLFSSAILLEMATGSGKTFTVGRYIDRMMSMISRHPELSTSMRDLKIILLSNRIDGVAQFRDDLTLGRVGDQSKPPVLSSDHLKNLRVSTYHSQADGDDLSSRSGETEVSNELGSHELICVTDKTACIHDIATRLPHVDLIIVDEAHNTNLSGDLFEVLSSLERRGRGGRSPLIVALTATPSNITKDLFGESRYTFGLSEYLASGYAPYVDYQIVTSMSAESSQVARLQGIIAQAKGEDNIKTKKALIREASDLFDSLQLPGDERAFVEDLTARAGVDDGTGSKKLEETVIFASSIEEADKIASLLDPTGSGYAYSYHSANDSNRAIDRLRDPADPCKVVIAVGKLNESIDLPAVKNVVFYRVTGSAKIYLQQFGRGLRGDGTVQYYDYTASLKNFAWIGNIHQEYRDHKKIQTNNLGDLDNTGANTDPIVDHIKFSDAGIEKSRKAKTNNTQKNHGFGITSASLHGIEYEINLTTIGLDIISIKHAIDVSVIPDRDDVLDFLTEIYISTDDLLSLTTQQIKEIEHPIGGKVTNLAKLSGWDNPQKLQLESSSEFRSWVRWLYGLPV